MIQYTIDSTCLDNWTEHSELKKWIITQIELCKPRNIHLCTGSEQENKTLLHQMVLSGTLVQLGKEYPNCYLARSSPADVARVESRTFICSTDPANAGPTNNWSDPVKMLTILTALFDGCMSGRTMYIIPFCMGPIDSPFSAIGIQITDSPYAVVNMRIMTRMGSMVLQKLGENGVFVPCIHTVGVPLKPGMEDSVWPQNSNKYICHFPETREIWSFGSGYGGNALLGKKCYALRIASVMGKQEGWLAEHMLIMGVTNPQGEKKYFAAAFPSACGKTNFAMMIPSLSGWKIEVVGDDIAWIRVDSDGKLRAINPEAGYFGVAPGTSLKTNSVAIECAKKNSIYTNVAVDMDGNPWWEGMSVPPQRLISWTRKTWEPGCGEYAAHPNSRFTAPACNCPILDPCWDDPRGVILDAIIFGGRRSDTIPLVHQAFNWEHGVYLGATMMSETTAAAEGKRGELRNDPFAMLPFCGYNMGDYFAHWLSFTKRVESNNLPKIFYVNWFNKDENGQFIWPGFGENSRVIEWIFKRCAGHCEARETFIGYLPDELNIEGLNINMESLFRLDKQKWQEEYNKRAQFLKQFGNKLPIQLVDMHKFLVELLDQENND